MRRVRDLAFLSVSASFYYNTVVKELLESPGISEWMAPYRIKNARTCSQ